jgi:hypothetical protein
VVAYSFQRRFVAPIREGSKRQTVRAVGKRRHAQPGQELQLYTGMRTKHCQHIAPATCREVAHIWINFDVPSVTTQVEIEEPQVFRGRLALDVFARDDGFSSWPEFVEFWSQEHFEGRAPEGIWNGVIVKW